MKPPFEIIKQGGAKLEWAPREDFGFWLRAVCKHCGKPGPICIGNRGGKPGSKLGNKLLSEAAGYSLVKYRRTYLRKGRYKGWRFSGVRVTVVKDLCPSCFEDLGKYITAAYGNTVLGRGKKAHPPTLELMQHYCTRWRFAKVKTKFQKMLKNESTEVVANESF